MTKTSPPHSHKQIKIILKLKERNRDLRIDDFKIRKSKCQKDNIIHVMLGLHIATMRYECHSWHIRNTRNEM